MKKGISTHVCLAFLLGLILFPATSCVCVHGCDGSRERLVKYERQVERTARLAPGSSLSAQTNDGSIRLEGIPTEECRLTATIVARATTEERARELAEQIEARLEPSVTELAVATEKPETIRNARYGVSLEGTVPTQTSLALVTNDGSIHTSLPLTVQGKVGKSLVGTVGAGEGKIILRTHDGSITIR